MAGSAVIMNNRILANLDDVRDQLGTSVCDALTAFDRSARNQITPQEFYDSDNPDGSRQEPEYVPVRFDPGRSRRTWARQYIEHLIHSDLATEPDQTTPAYGLQNYLMNNPAYMNLYSIEGGNERLPRELAARIEATILLGHQVCNVVKAGNDRLRIDCVHQGKNRQDEFDFVVIALPHNQLNSVTFSGDQLTIAIGGITPTTTIPHITCGSRSLRRPLLAELALRFLLDAGSFRRLLSVRRILP